MEKDIQAGYGIAEGSQETTSASSKGYLESLAERKKSVVATGVGNTLEWFDWTIYAVFAPFIAAAMFNPQDKTSALLSTLAVFSVGFLFRPLGGLIFGIFADKLGRKGVLLTTMLMMSAASLMIAITPSYAEIGGWASLLLLIARLLQGFAHGGESTASYAYLSEIAPPEKRAFWSSSMFFCVGIGSMIATLTGVLLTSTLDNAVLSDWGWRVPFFIGALLSLAVLFLRRNMIESDAYEDAQHQTASIIVEKSIKQPTQEWSKNKIVKRAIGIFFYQAATTLPYYIWTAYAAVFAITTRGMDAKYAFLATLGAQLVNIIMVPITGYISDRIGRRPVTIFFFVSMAILTPILMPMITSNPLSLFFVQSIMLAIVACIGGTQPAIIAERVPTKYRARIMGTSMPLAVALFGGTAPYLNSWFFSNNLGWVMYVYIAVTCAIGTFVVFNWKETKGIHLSDVN
ncbi:MFS transporter [Acinetobacter chengduensis]|uniref:MFS transporter n=1 Tax=Acinetobacter chengduensis TaxID=2420890 RepID=A0ABX9TWG7_9GAMM|nr:MFS transporter [Acinetobacter chengduensis]RLL21814.1 MFS transporter [Acinetobacter chengduensis]